MNLNCNKSDKEEIINYGKEINKQFKAIKPSCKTCRSCCCRNCAVYNGHYEIYGNGISPIHLEQLKQLKKEYKFTEDKGFLGNKGCKLPHHLRSFTCTRYLCFQKYSKLSRINEDNLLQNIKNLFRYRIKINFLPDLDTVFHSINITPYTHH